MDADQQAAEHVYSLFLCLQTNSDRYVGKSSLEVPKFRLSCHFACIKVFHVVNVDHCINGVNKVNVVDSDVMLVHTTISIT